MGCSQSKPTVIGYYEPNGRLIQYHGSATSIKHHPTEELSFVNEHDVKLFYPGMECYLLHAGWIETWLNYTMNQPSEKIPGPISNNQLLNKQNQFDEHKEIKKDYRPIHREVWEYLFQLYGGGPVICFKVPYGIADEKYEKGTWLKEVNLTDYALIIFPDEKPKPTTYQVTRNPLILEQKIAKENTTIAANQMLHDLGASKIREAKKLDAEISKENTELISAMLVNDLAKQKMKAATKVEAEQNQAAMDEAANIFAGNLTNKKLEEAKLAQEEVNISQTQNVLETFDHLNAKNRLKAALTSGNQHVAEEAAATLLKSAWRSKLARRRVYEMKFKKIRLMEEAMARKLQSKYRSRLAKKRVNELRIKKQKLREEGCAIKLQSAWRCKKSRQKINELKIKKQKLLEEGAALMLQSAWRIRQARSRVGKLRQDKAVALEKKRIEEENLKKEKLDKSMRCVKKLLKLLLSRIRFRKLLKALPHVMMIKLMSASDINIGDISSSDPYVIFHAEKPRTASQTTQTKQSSPASATITTSITKSKVIYVTLNPVWNEDCLLANVDINGDLMLTLMDKDKLSKDDFLGQTKVSLKAHANQLLKNLYSKNKEQSIEFTLPIGNYSTPVCDANGKVIPLNSTQTVGKGTIRFSIHLASLTYTHTGKLMKKAGAVMGLSHGSYKPRYFVLHHQVLKYFEDPFSLDHSRGDMNMLGVDSINVGPDEKGVNTVEITGSSDNWYIQLCPGDPESVLEGWIRKLQYACRPGVYINGIVPVNPLQMVGNRHLSTGTITSSTSNSTKPIVVKSAFGKRSSNLFK